MLVFAGFKQRPGIVSKIYKKLCAVEEERAHNIRERIIITDRCSNFYSWFFSIQKLLLLVWNCNINCSYSIQFPVFIVRAGNKTYWSPGVQPADMPIKRSIKSFTNGYSIPGIASAIGTR